jgi:hypothetical protein
MKNARTRALSFVLTLLLISTLAPVVSAASLDSLLGVDISAVELPAGEDSFSVQVFTKDVIQPYGVIQFHIALDNGIRLEGIRYNSALIAGGVREETGPPIVRDGKVTYLTGLSAGGNIYSAANLLCTLDLTMIGDGSGSFAIYGASVARMNDNPLTPPVTEMYGDASETVAVTVTRADEPGTPGTTEPGIDEPGTPGTTEPGIDEPGTPGTTEPGIDEPGTPGTTEPGIDEPGTPGTTEPGIDEPGTPGTTEPGIDEPGTPGTTEPGIDEPGTPGTTEPGIDEPGTPGTTEPGIDEPGTPGTTEPGIDEPGENNNNGSGGRPGSGVYTGGGAVVGGDSDTGTSGGVEIDEEAAPTSAANPFSDIQGHWAEEYIVNLYLRGVVNGTTATTFEPERPITRAEALKIVLEAFSMSSSAVSSAFTDVASDKWYFDYICQGSEMELIKGYEDGTFRPEQNIARQELCVIMMRALERAGKIIPERVPESAFNDGLSIHAYASDAVRTLQKAGVISGYEDGSFRPLNPVTRAETAKIVSEIIALL